MVTTILGAGLSSCCCWNGYATEWGPLLLGSCHASAVVMVPSFRCFLSFLVSIRRYCRSRNSTKKSTQTRSEEHTSELQSLMRISYAVFCLTKKKYNQTNTQEYN